jgi:hypothetical protein
VSLTALNFDDFVAEHDAVFVQFSVPSSATTKDLATSWETTDAAVRKQWLPVTLATVDCAIEARLCSAQHNIGRTLTLRWFQYGKAVASGYPETHDRNSTAELLDYVHQTLTAASFRTSRFKTVELTPFDISSTVDAKKDANNEVHMDGKAAEATTADKNKAVTKRATTSIQETTKGVIFDRKFGKKRSQHNVHAGERPVVRGTL